MESTGAFHDGDWIPNMMFSSEEQLEFTPLIFGQFSLPHEHFEGSNFAQLTFCPTSDANNICLDSGVNDNLVHSLGSFNSSMHYISQENNSYSSYNSIAFTPSSVDESHHHFQVSNGISMSLDACVMDQKNCASHMTDFNTDIVMGEISLIKEEASNDHVMLMNSNDKEATVSSISEKELQLKRKVDVPQPTDSTQICNKKPRVPRDVLKCKKNVQSKKNQKGGVTNGKDEENKKGQEGQSSCCYSSEEDNGSQERNGREVSETKTSATDPNLIGKTRASRGSATDPQSLYARKRRERINERLRILQNLIPNGTKVDISTMLEEAVSYVKFLQLQIKLLSSDDLWMYAPIAYNGVDIGFTQKISPLL